MYVPSGKTFLLHSLKLNGPCLSPHLNIEINGNIVAPSEPSEWRCITHRCDKWILIKRVNGLTVNGTGTINGQGHKWWNVNDRRRPTAFEITRSKNISVRGLRLKDSPRVHLHFLKVESATVSNITVDTQQKVQILMVFMSLLAQRFPIIIVELELGMIVSQL